MDGGEQLGFERLVVKCQHRFERTDQVADDIFRRIMDQRSEPIAAVEHGRKVPDDALHQQAVLGHREGVLALRLSVPARDAGKPMGNVLDLDVER